MDFCLSPPEATSHQGDRNRNSEFIKRTARTQSSPKKKRERIGSENPVYKNHREIVQTMSGRHKDNKICFRTTEMLARLLMSEVDL